MALWQLRKLRNRDAPNQRAFTYSRWDGTQTGFDPSGADIFSKLKDQLMEHGDPMSALQQMLSEGFQLGDEHIKGLREMLRELRQRRQEKLDSHNLVGMYDDIARELREILEVERNELESRQTESQQAGKSRQSETQQPETHTENNFHTLSDKQLQLDMLPPDLPGQLQSLQDYDFTSPEARRRFMEMLSQLRQQLMENFVSQLTDQAKNMSADDLNRAKEMLAELNQMLEQYSQGEEPDFDAFMDRFGDFFPENPNNLEELLQSLAQRMAAMQALLNSMTPEQRSQLDQLVSQLMADIDMNWQMSQLSSHLRQLFPDAGWQSSYDLQGVDPLSFPDALQLMSELGDIDQLENLLSNANHPGALADVDLEQVKDLLGEEAADSLGQLSQLAEKLEQDGLLENNDGTYQMTPNAIRRLGQHALADLFAQLSRDKIGGHELREEYQGGHEKEFDTKPYEWGDPFKLDIQRTVRNAIMRLGGGVPVRLSVEDFEIERSENLVRSSTVLLLDLSLSMPIRGNFLPAKKVAFALWSLITSQFPRDFLGIVGFSDIAQPIAARQLPQVSWEYVHGTNMQHALILARQMLAAQSGFKQVIMVTDGEPTAHLTEDGQPYFSYPPSRATVIKTLREVKRCTKEDIRINVFMLDATDYLAHFVEQITKMNGGRAFFTTPDNLGDYVLVDFVEHKRRLLSGWRAG